MRVQVRPFCACVFICSSLAAPGAERVIVQNGGSNYEIVRAATASPIARLAAEELRRFVKRATGVGLPIVAAPSPGRGHIFVGANPASAAAGVTPDDLKPEGFHIKTVGRDIHIVGRDVVRGSIYPLNASASGCGSLTGVYEFLERCVGVLFCWGDELGVVTPKRKRIAAPDLDVTDAPDWSYRVLAYSPQGATSKLYGRRLRLGHPYTVSHSHAWFRIAPIEKYGDTHPELYALVKGRRASRYSLGRHGGQVCTTNPETIELFARVAIDYFNKHPNRDMFSISPNDGGGFCQCARCRALDVEMLDELPDMPMLTDRLLTFYNAVAERVVKAHPNKMLGAYIYSYYSKPPRRVRPHPMLALVNASDSALNQGVGWKREHEWEKQWVALTKRFYKYDIYYYGRTSLHLIAPVTTHLIEKIKAEQATGLRGGYFFIGQSYEQLGAGHYLLARLMWDKDADARALERRYYNALYGAAGPDVLAYYHLLESRLRKMCLDRVDVDEPGVKSLLRHGMAGNSPGHIVAAYWPILNRASRLIARAQSRPLSERERRRIERLADQHELLAATVRGMIAAGRLEEQAEFNVEDAAMLKAAVEQREKVRAKLRRYAPTLTKYLDRAEQETLGRLSPDGAFYRLAQGGRKLALTAVRAKRAPRIDGRGDDPIWRKARFAYLLLARSATPPRLGARARLAFDDRRLYVLIEGRDGDTTRLLKQARGKDAPALFNEDNVELFLMPPGGAAYYHIGLGAGGALYDAAHPTGKASEADATWDSHALAGVRIDPRGWTAELAVPFAALNAGPTDGGEWRMNVCRTRRGAVEPDEYMAASPTLGGFHKPRRFALLRFVESDDSPAFALGAFEAPAKAFGLGLRAAGIAKVEISDRRAYCGPSAAHIIISGDGVGQITLTAKVKPNTGYRALYAHYNDVAALKSGVRPAAPITRVIFRDDAGKAVTPTKGYSWSGAQALDKPRRWRISPHVFTTPSRAVKIAFTLFFMHPGEYWVDEARLEELGALPL